MNMIEKVARAMLEADAHAYPDEYMIGFNRRLELAKAAIEAMRDDLKAHLKYDEEGVIDRIDAALEGK